MESLLHPLTARQLHQATALPAGAYLFHGGVSRGKARAARELARQLNCTAGCELGALVVCANCVVFRAGNHPHLAIVTLQDKSSIGIEQIRQLQADLALKSYAGTGQRVVVIDGAELLTTEAQNALLKLVEEPAPSTVMILTATDPERLLATVRSRCQAIFFPPLSDEAIASFLMQHDDVTGVLATEIAALADGAIGLARQLAADETKLETYRRLDALGTTLLEATTFERLVAARQLVDAKAPLGVLVQRLQASLQAALREGASDGRLQAERLEAVARFWQRTEANVSARVALESLLLEV